MFVEHCSRVCIGCDMNDVELENSKLGVDLFVFLCSVYFQIDELKLLSATDFT